MKFFTRKGTIQKILLVLIVLILFNFIAPQYAYCFDLADVGGKLLGELLQLFAAVGDVIMGTLGHFMLGTDFTSAMLSQKDININNSESWLYAGDEQADVTCVIGESTGDNLGIDDKGIFGIDAFQIPNMLYSPEAIFANDIAALDVNFLRSNTYTAISDTAEAEKKTESTASKLRGTIATWYRSFRNIAIVGLLSVLVYLGIRILISTAATDKAKYKESLQDWFVALCLVFTIQFVMSGILMVTDKFTELFASSVDGNIIVSIPANDGGSNISNGEEIKFRTNLIGLVRFEAQAKEWQVAVANSIMYLVLVGYTLVFTFMYFKRFLYLAFFTMISPLVALTYPIDRAGDGKAQAFNMWFKEYVGNVIIQPVHLLLYSALVASAIDLAKDNIIYALVAIGFLIPAEKIIKQMFRLDKSSTAPGFGSMALGSYVGNKLASAGKGALNRSGNKGGKDGSDSSDKDGNSRIRTTNQNPALSTFKENNNVDNSENDQSSPVNPQDKEHQKMLKDRETWDNMANDENETEENRADARREVDNIDNNMKTQGYMPNENETGQSQNQKTTTSGQGQGKNGNANASSTQQQLQNRNKAQGVKPRSKRKVAKKLALKGAKKMGKVAYKGAKLAVAGTGAVMGAGIGLAAGIATGDLSNAISFASAGVGAGLIAGRKLGNASDSVINGIPKIGEKVQDVAQGVKNDINEATYGETYATQQANLAANEREKKKFMKNKNEEEKYRQMALRIKQKTGQDYDAKELMEAGFDYKASGVKDDEHIERGLMMEADRGGIKGNDHAQMMDVMNFAQNFSADNIRDDKKWSQLEGTVDSMVPKSRKEEVLSLTAEALGQDKYYNKHRKHEIEGRSQTRRNGNTSNENTRENTSRRTETRNRRTDNNA